MKMIQFAALFLAALGLAFSSSCATTRGFGQDLQKVGSKLENEADATGGAQPLNSTGYYDSAPASNVPPAY